MSVRKRSDDVSPVDTKKPRLGLNDGSLTPITENEEEDENTEEEEDLSDSDFDIEEKLKETDPEAYDSLMGVRAEIERTEPNIVAILKEPLLLSDRTKLVQLYEVYKGCEPSTEEYLEARDTVNKTFSDMKIGYAHHLKYTMDEHEQMTAEIKSFTSFDSRAAMKYKIMKLEADKKTKEVIYQKYQEFLSKRPNDDEYGKLQNWLMWATEIPHNHLKSFNYDNLTDFLKNVSIKLDAELFGMEKVKEQLLIFLNAKIRNPSMKKCSLGLVGPPGVGKCLGKNTPIAMFDGTTRLVQDVECGDLLMGDDSKPRRVDTLARGTEQMYKICQDTGDDYTVNSSHILSLRNTRKLAIYIKGKRYLKDDIIDIQLEDYLRLLPRVQSYLKGYKVGVDYEHRDVILDPYIMGLRLGNKDFEVGAHTLSIPKLYIINSREVRLKVLAGLLDSRAFLLQNKYEMVLNHMRFAQDVKRLVASLGLCVTVSKYSGHRDRLFISGMGLKEVPVTMESKRMKPVHWSCNLVNTNIEVKAVGVDEYYGFTIDGNRRFLLGDYTVTHNTACARLLADVMDYPLEQIACGGVSGPEFFRGHDFTYVGSGPGEIVKCLRRAGCKNMIMYLDEYEKVSENDATCAALLGITDPSQNGSYRDLYLADFTIDLGNVWFIKSMNAPPKDSALRDRIFIIDVPGYSFSDKVRIITDYVVPKACKNAGLNTDAITFDAVVAGHLVTKVCGREDKGVRTIEKAITDLVNKISFIVCHQDANGTLEGFKMSFDPKVILTYPIVVTAKLLDTLMESKNIDMVMASMYI